MLCSAKGGKSPTSRFEDSSYHRLQNRPEVGGGDGRKIAKSGTITGISNAFVECLRKKKHRNSSGNLVERDGCGPSLPSRAIRDARSSSTMEQYEFFFGDWIGWLDSVKLQQSPHSLWLFLDQLRGTVAGKSARKVRSAILYCLKISGQFYSPPAGEPSLSYSDERLKLIAVGVEKKTPKVKHSPKLPLRWFHLDKLVTQGQKDQFWLRDIALLIVGLFAFMRAAEIAQLSPKDFRQEDDGAILVTFWRAKADLDASMTTIRINDLAGFGFSITNLLQDFIDSRNHTSISSSQDTIEN